MVGSRRASMLLPFPGTDEQNVVASGRGDFEGALYRFLPPDVDQVHLVLPVAWKTTHRRQSAPGRQLQGPLQKDAASRRLPTGMTSSPETTAASGAFSRGTRIPRLRSPGHAARWAAHRAPDAAPPVSASSPTRDKVLEPLRLNLLGWPRESRCRWEGRNSGLLSASLQEPG